MKSKVFARPIHLLLGMLLFSSLSAAFAGPLGVGVINRFEGFYGVIRYDGGRKEMPFRVDSLSQPLAVGDTVDFDADYSNGNVTGSAVKVRKIQASQPPVQARPLIGTTSQEEGYIAMFNEKGKYGFIKGQGALQSLFFDSSSFSGITPREGDSVRYTLTYTAKGMKVMNMIYR